MTATTTLKTERLADLGELADVLELTGLPVTDLDRPGPGLLPLRG